MVTIQDVARRAGVSTATASRAISGYGYVSPASRDQVLAAADGKKLSSVNVFEKQ